MNNYTIYHLHSDYSNTIAGMDSVTPIEAYIKKASEYGMTHLAFSEHGSVFNWTAKKELIESYGMHYIHAIEVYVTEDLTPPNGKLIRDNYHMVLIAKNWDGVKEINKLSSKSFNKDDGHYYYQPRISIDEIINTSNNIIVTTACIAGALGIKANENIREKVINFLRTNKDRCFLEIQHHNSQKQKEHNEYLVKLSKEINVPLVAGTDTHSLNKEYATARLIAERGAGKSYPDEEEFNLEMMSYKELIKAYELQGCLERNTYLEAIENTNKIADMVEDFTLDLSYKYPKIYDNAEKVFWDKIVNAFYEHPYASKRYTWEEVEPRVREEYEVMRDTGAIDFMLLQNHIREWERNNNVLYGFGRGSVGGCFIAYLLRITEVDSIKYNLPFSRFMSRERVSLADIDTDYDDESREKTRNFLIEQHLGLPQIKACQIITFGTMQAKKAIEYIGKGLGYSLKEVDTIKELLGGKNEDEITDLIIEKYPELARYVQLVIGVIINSGIHASGILVSDKDIDEEIGLCHAGSSPYVVSVCDMHELDVRNFVKFDLLGLQNLKLINLVAQYCNLDRPTPDSNYLDDMQDVDVYRNLREDTTMIFQYESSMAFAFMRRFFSEETMSKVLKRLGDIDFVQMGAISNAALRPAGTSYRDEISDGEFVDYELSQFTDYLNPTFGRLIFQESITGWLQEFAGYSGGEADVVRRAIAKKKGTEQLLPEIEKRFIATMRDKYDTPESKSAEIIKPFLQTIEDASSYAFNKAHALSYWAVAYISTWFRTYHTVEWVTAGLNTFDGNIEKTANITTYAKKNKIKIMPIKFRHSRKNYSFDTQSKEIYKGLRSIKYMNANVAESLYNLRDKRYNTFVDLLVDIERECDVNSRQMNILIKLDFFSEFGEINALLHTFQIFNEVFNGKESRNISVSYAEKHGLPQNILKELATKTTEKTYIGVDILILFKKLESNYKKAIPARSIHDLICDQNEYLGYIDITDKQKYKNIVYVKDVITTYSPRVDVYCLANGNILTCKINKKLYADKCVKANDFMMIDRYQYKPKYKMDKETGRFVPSATETELWITKYQVIDGNTLKWMCENL